MILAHLYDLLKKQGLSPIEAKDKIFNPDFHEALLHVENDKVPENTIVEELQKGYLLNNRVVRTAKVKVSKRTENRGQSTEYREQRAENRGEGAQDK